MKRIISCLLAVLLFASLAGCGLAEKLEKKAGEKAAEGFLGGIGGGDVDIDGDKMTFKGEDGEAFTMGGTEWPASELAKVIPEFTKGEITSVIESSDGVMVGVDSVEEADYGSYLEDIKKDFTADAYEMNSEDYKSYSAGNADGVIVFLQYGNNSLSITVTREAE